MAKNRRRTTPRDRQHTAEWHHQVAAECTPEIYRDTLVMMLRSVLRMARGDVHPHALPDFELDDLRMHLTAAMDVIQCSEIESRPAVLEACRAAAAAAADEPLQAWLGRLTVR